MCSLKEENANRESERMKINNKNTGKKEIIK